MLERTTTTITTVPTITATTPATATTTTTTTMAAKAIANRPLLNFDVKLTNAELTLFQCQMGPSQPMFLLTDAVLLCPRSPEEVLWVDVMNRNRFDAAATVALVVAVAAAAATAPIAAADFKQFNHPIENDLLDLFVNSRLRTLLQRMNAIPMLTHVVLERTS